MNELHTHDENIEAEEIAAESVRNEYREAAQWALAEFEQKWVAELVRLRSLPTDCLLFANNFGHKIGCLSQSDIVSRHKRKRNAKALVNKYLKSFQLGIRPTLELAPLANGQRTARACAEMTAARIEQLKPKQ